MSDKCKKKNKKHTKAAMLINGEIYVVRSLHFMTWTCSGQKIGRIKCRLYVMRRKMHITRYN